MDYVQNAVEDLTPAEQSIERVMKALLKNLAAQTKSFMKPYTQEDALDVLVYP